LSHDSSPPSRPSACPALSRIVAARDGGLCRIKLPGGELRAEQALAIAEAIDTHTSGVVEVTNRANLQLRGVRAGHEAALSEQLLCAGLGPQVTIPQARSGTQTQWHSVPITAAADDVRNLMISPAAGRDAQASYDTRPLAAAILSLLQSEARLTALSPKFALLLDGGERLAMLDHPHDIWLCAMPTHGDEPWFAFGLAGHPSIRHRCALAAVRPVQVPALVRALLHAFLDLARPEDTRMRHVLAAYSHDTILEHVSSRVDFPLRRGANVDAWRRADADPALRFGAHSQRAGNLWHVGGQPPLGRIDAATLRGLALLAIEHGNGTLSMTPWQSVLLPDVAEPSVPHVQNGLDALGLICDVAHPLAGMVACAGSAGCAKSCADTKADALHLSQRLPAGVEVHLSGCIRSCAAAHCAPYTLLAVEPGRYDLYRQAADPDQETAYTRAPEIDTSADTSADAARRFGSRIAAHLTIEQAAQLLREAARSHSHA
jgi:precorrin-3B synthase